MEAEALPIPALCHGTPTEGKPDGDSDVESCTSCNDDYNPYTLRSDNKICIGDFALHPNGVTVLCPYAADGASGMVGSTEYTKRTPAQIKPLARGDASQRLDAAASCTSGITDMSELFLNANTFNQNIGNWDVSMVTNMSGMFRGATAFNQNIGNWDVSMVTNMQSMFNDATAFNQNIGGWGCQHGYEYGRHV